jgi:hypothetical protein
MGEPKSINLMAYQQWHLPGHDKQGRTISIEKASKSAPYVATLWEDGLPVTRKPMETQRALEIIATL